MNYPSNQYYFKGHKITLSWIRSDNISSFTPITQAYPIIFNSKDKILICRRDKNSDWQLPGGTIEKSESIKETLIREVLEEVDVEIFNIKDLGVQRVEFPNNPNQKEGEVFYQARSIAKVKRLLLQTIDPDSKLVWERKLVPASKIKEYVKWGKTGDAMFEDAINLNQQ